MDARPRHPVVEEAINQISAHKKKRLAYDGRRYTLEQVVDAYGEDAGHKYWKEAPHYLSLPSFRFQWNLLSMRSYHDRFKVTHSGSGAELYAACGEFGIVFPEVFMLVAVKHLHGKLKCSRLAPQGWLHQEEVWDNGLVIGVGDGTVGCDSDRDTIRVADFREDAYNDTHLATLCSSTMREAATHFLRFLDDSEYMEFDPELMEFANPIMEFLCVVVDSP